MNFKSKLCWILLLISFTLLAGCSGQEAQQGAEARPGKVSGKVLDSDQQISTSLSDEEQPSVAYDNVNHRYLTVWSDLRNGSADIYGRLASGQSLYDDGITPGGIALPDNDPRVQPNKLDGWPKLATPPLDLGGEIRITDSSAAVAASDQRQPKVAFYPNLQTPAASKYLVIWNDTRNGYSQIFGQFLSVAGGYLDSNGDAVGAPSNFAITERVDGPGRGTVSVTGAYSFPLSNGSISISAGAPTTVIGAGTSFNSMTAGDLIIIEGVGYAVESIASDFELTLRTPYTGFPVLNSIPQSVSGLQYLSYGSQTPSDVINGVGTSFVADGIKPGDMISISNIYYQIATVDSATRLTLTTPAIHSFTGSGLPYSTTAHLNQADPDIVYNPVRKLFVVSWTDVSNRDTNNTMRLTGATCSNSVLVNYLTMVSADDKVIRYVEINPDRSARPALPVIGNKQDVSTIVTTRQTMDSGSSLSHIWSVQVSESKPKVGVNPNSGEIFVAWSGKTRPVTMNLDYTKNPSPATTCTYKAPVFTRPELDETSRIKLRSNAGLGQVKDFSFGTQGSMPSVSVAPYEGGKLLLAWEENTGSEADGKDVLGRLIDLVSFEPEGDVINISDAVGHQTSPITSYDNVNDRFLVVWEDARNQRSNISNIDIYGQFVDPQEGLSGGNTIITVAPSNQLSPAAVFGDGYFRKFLVVWKDARLNNNANIGAQLMEYSTLPQLVIADGEGSPILNGSINFGNVDIAGATPYRDIPFQIRNDGNTTLTINSVTPPSAPYSFITPSPKTVDPGTSAQMTIRFKPTGAGSYTGHKMVFNSDGGEAVIYLSGAGVGVQPLSIASTSLPDATVNLAYSGATLSATGGEVPYSPWSVTAGSLPPGLTLNSTTGVISGTVSPAAGASYTFTVSVRDNAGTSISKTFTMNVTSMTITNSVLKPWTQLHPGYTDQLSAAIGANAVNPELITWSAVGAVPQGLTLSPRGAVTGTPLLAGATSMTVTATYVDSTVQPSKTYSATKTLLFTVNPALTIQTTTLPAVVVGNNYSQNLTRLGGTPSYSWSVVSGVLPAGLNLDSSTGAISGIPTGTGSTFTVRVADAVGDTFDRGLTIQVNPTLAITTPALPSVKSGASYIQSLSATGGTAPYSWTVVAGFLPPGITLSSTGILSGNAGGVGPYEFIAAVTDRDATTVNKLLSINVNSDVLTTSPVVYVGSDGATQGSLAFGGRLIGGTTTRTLLLKNNGATPITISGATSGDSANFPVSVMQNYTVPAGESVPVEIWFTPKAVRSYNTTVNVNDTSGTSYPLAVSGTGVSATASLGTTGNGSTDATTIAFASIDPSTAMLNGSGKPAGFVTASASGIRVDNMVPQGTVNVTVQYRSLSSTQKFYTVVNNTWTEITPVSKDLGAATATFAITDNNSLHDSDPRPGYIQDTLAVGSVGAVVDPGTGTGGGGGSNTPPPSEGGKSGGGCFIATAAYGSYLDPQVVVLRNFRDQVLLQSAAGTAFVKFYYQHSPAIADFIYRHDTLRLFTRWALTPLIVAVKYPVTLLVLPLFVLYRVRRSCRPAAAALPANAEN